MTTQLGIPTTVPAITQPSYWLLLQSPLHEPQYTGFGNYWGPAIPRREHISAHSGLASNAFAFLVKHHLSTAFHLILLHAIWILLIWTRDLLKAQHVQSFLVLLFKLRTDASWVPIFHSQFLKLTLQAESSKVCNSASVCNFCLLFIPSFGRIKYQNKTIKRKKRRNKQAKDFPLNISIPSKAMLQWLWEDSRNIAVKWLSLKRNNCAFSGPWSLLDGNRALHTLHAAYGEYSLQTLFNWSKTVLHMHEWLRQLCCELCVDRAYRLKQGLCKKTASHLFLITPNSERILPPSAQPWYQLVNVILCMQHLYKPMLSRDPALDGSTSPI